MKTNSLLPA